VLLLPSATDARRQKPAKKRVHSAASAIHKDRSQKEDELTRLKQEIADCRKQLSEHEANAARSKRNLSAFNKRTRDLEATIERLSARVDDLEAKKEVVEDSLQRTANTLDQLKATYASSARFLYTHGALEHRSPDEYMLAGASDDHERQSYYAALVARAHAMNKDRLDSAKRALGQTRAGLTYQLASSANAIDRQTVEEQRIESQKQEEAKRLAQIEQDRERLKKTLQQNQASAKRLERMIADLIIKEENAAKTRREAVRKAKKGSAPNRKQAKFEDDLAEPGRTYGPHSLRWPTASHQIRQGFGEHRNASLGTVTMNLGVDIAATEGSPVYAAADGIVSLVSSLPSYGTIVVLQHSGGLHTVYADLSGVNVRVGSRVNAGQTIARSGANEESGSLLHFEVWKGKTRQNPMGWLR
jgi:septal ring factor EnvC (AmiA/AmiB activator)